MQYTISMVLRILIQQSHKRMSTTIKGGYYIGTDGKPHDANGKPIPFRGGGYSPKPSTAKIDVLIDASEPLPPDFPEPSYPDFEDISIDVDKEEAEVPYPWTMEEAKPGWFYVRDPYGNYYVEPDADKPKKYRRKKAQFILDTKPWEKE